MNSISTQASELAPAPGVGSAGPRLPRRRRPGRQPRARRLRRLLGPDDPRHAAGRGRDRAKRARSARGACRRRLPGRGPAGGGRRLLLPGDRASGDDGVRRHPARRRRQRQLRGPLTMRTTIGAVLVALALDAPSCRGRRQSARGRQRLDLERAHADELGQRRLQRPDPPAPEHGAHTRSPPPTATPRTGFPRSTSPCAGGRPRTDTAGSRSGSRCGRTAARAGSALRRSGRLHTETTQLVVDRGSLRARLYKRGKKIWDARVGVGKSSTPTPSGNFWIREKFKTGNAGGSYGRRRSAPAPIPCSATGPVAA